VNSMPKDYFGESVIEMLSWIRPEFHISEKMSDQGRDFALRIIFLVYQYIRKNATNGLS